MKKTTAGFHREKELAEQKIMKLQGRILEEPTGYVCGNEAAKKGNEVAPKDKTYARETSLLARWKTPVKLSRRAIPLVCAPWLASNCLLDELARNVATSCSKNIPARQSSRNPTSSCR